MSFKKKVRFPDFGDKYERNAETVRLKMWLIEIMDHGLDFELLTDRQKTIVNNLHTQIKAAFIALDGDPEEESR